MKAITNFLRKSEDVKSMSNLSAFALSIQELAVIKGGTEPILPNPGTPVTPPPSKDI